MNTVSRGKDIENTESSNVACLVSQYTKTLHLDGMKMYKKMDDPSISLLLSEERGSGF